MRFFPGLERRWSNVRRRLEHALNLAATSHLNTRLHRHAGS
jgi:hypothetical protein